MTALLRLLVVLVILAQLPRSVAHAHGGRLPFLFWGNFPRFAIPCQKAIGRAAALCAARSAQARFRCTIGQDTSCSATDLESQREAILRVALNLIDRFCSDRAAVQLGFLGTIEAQSDIANMCTTVNRDLSFVFEPTDEPSPTGDCTRSVSGAVVRLLRSGTMIWEELFNRVALKGGGAKGRTLITRARARISLQQQKLANVIRRHCTDESVTAIYGTTTSELLNRAARLTECVAGAAYVQDAIHCDTAQSGGSLSP
ncbi:MAG: hypothetical protein N3C12_09490 [Candidatus Binatia bacterium]|nr:hypothetical protein [Candidatus Binatia bacterium]